MGHNAPETIALIEVGGSHDECLLTQMHALRQAGHNCLMICTQDIRTRNPEFEKYINAFYIVSFDGGKLDRVKEMRRALKFMEKKGASRAVLNTAQGDLVRNLCLLAIFSPIEFTGIIHTTRKLKGSFTQRVISRKVKKYLLLSNYLLSTVEPPKGAKLDYFYPIRFSESTTTIEKRKRVVTIIGGVENRRKDLDGFLDMLESVKSLDLQFFFLGRSDQNSPDVQKFKAKLKKKGLEENVVMFNDFVEHDQFSAIVRNTDLILPLVHPNTPSADQYFKNQISGAMSISFGYKVPMLIHKEYAHIKEMQAASFYYSQDQFSEVLQKAFSELPQKTKLMMDIPEYNVAENESRYCQFVLS